MERENAYLLLLAILMFSSVVSLSALGVTKLALYVAVLSLSYFAASFLVRPRRRGLDLVGFSVLVLFLASAALEVL